MCFKLYMAVKNIIPVQITVIAQTNGTASKYVEHLSITTNTTTNILPAEDVMMTFPTG